MVSAFAAEVSLGRVWSRRGSHRSDRTRLAIFQVARLTDRAIYAENAFLDVYKIFYEAPNPLHAYEDLLVCCSCACRRFVFSFLTCVGTADLPLEMVRV